MRGSINWRPKSVEGCAVTSVRIMLATNSSLAHYVVGLVAIATQSYLNYDIIYSYFSHWTTVPYIQYSTSPEAIMHLNVTAYIYSDCVGVNE
jgi:hypothetical protein